MNAQRLSRLIRPQNLTSFFIVLFALLVLAFGLGAGSAQSKQDGVDESDPDERKFINKIPAHIPIKVKLRNEQTFKKKENKNWARELEIEIKNTGAKPIYYIYVMFVLRDFLSGDGSPLAFLAKYGRPELAFLETPLEPEDVPILPGETITLKIHESQVKGYEVDREGRDDKKVELQMQYINFGDGTGFSGMRGEPDKAVKKSSAAPRREGKSGGCPPAPAARSADSPGGLFKVLYTLTPASFSRAKFSLADVFTTPSPAAQITGGCNNCQTGTDVCMWGKRELTHHCHCDPDDPNQQFAAVYPAGSCDNPSGLCLVTETIVRRCATRNSGEVNCPFQAQIGFCAVGDPTPTPPPSPSPSQSPGCTPPEPPPAACCTPEQVTFLNTSSCRWNCSPCPTGTVFANGCISMGGAVVCDDPYEFRVDGPSGADCCPPTPTPQPPPPPPPGGGTCTSATTENPWLDGQGCDLCWDGVDNDCNGLTDGQEPGCWNRCNCPVLIDTDGDGFSLTSAADGVLFDFNGDGTRERLSWTARGADDAWLALDRNGNGAIDDARELFGNLTAQPAPPAGASRNGFLALSEFDRAARGGNGDGVIDDRDAVFTSLRLWRDASHDGLSAPAELHTLASRGVARIHLDYKVSKREDEHGNRFRYRAKVDDAKGVKASRRAWDVFLVREP